MQLKSIMLGAASLALLASVSAQAAVVAGPNIGGFNTFTDTNTGYHWVKLNTFFSTSTTDMLAAVTPAGFEFADKDEVDELLNSLPLTGGEWPGYNAIMGGAPNRDLIWGVHAPLDASGLYGWSYAYGGDLAWSYEASVVAPGDIPNFGGQFADMNIWAYQGAVPEPATWALMIAGFGMVGGAMRRRTLAAA